MTCKVYFFNLTDCEKNFFETNKYDIFDIVFFETDLNETTIEQLIKDDLDSVMMLCINQNSKITQNMLKKFKNLRLISTRTKAIDNIDISACFENNIAIANVENEGDCCENLKTVFAGMSSYLCGSKDYRII